MTHPLVVVTGGPGSGKTTLIDLLAQAGHAVSPEAGRAVIQQQQAIRGDALPWRDRELFARRMLDHDIAHHAKAQALVRSGGGPVFFDRGVPDVAGYLALCGLPMPPEIDEAAHACRYDRRVFIAPFWPEIFANDAERRQDVDEARRTFEAMQAVYPRYGYDLIELPRTTPQERMAFVLDRVL